MRHVLSQRRCASEAHHETQRTDRHAPSLDLATHDTDASTWRTRLALDHDLVIKRGPCREHVAPPTERTSGLLQRFECATRIAIAVALRRATHDVAVRCGEPPAEAAVLVLDDLEVVHLTLPEKGP